MVVDTMAVGTMADTMAVDTMVVDTRARWRLGGEPAAPAGAERVSLDGRATGSSGPRSVEVRTAEVRTAEVRTAQSERHRERTARTRDEGNLPGMARLSEMIQRHRGRIGSLSIVLGALLAAGGVIIAHYALFPVTEVVAGVEIDVEVDYFGWIPRGWLPVTIGQIIAVTGAQLIVFGAAVLWVIDKRLTWARATFAAFLIWIELVFFFGIIPSEWLNLSQGPLDMSAARVAFTIPSWMVLGNEVAVTYAAIKDAISGAYNTIAPFVLFVLVYKLQDWGKKAPAEAAAPRTSPYGRPLVKGGE